MRTKKNQGEDFKEMKNPDVVGCLKVGVEDLSHRQETQVGASIPVSAAPLLAIDAQSYHVHIIGWQTYLLIVLRLDGVCGLLEY